MKALSFVLTLLLLLSGCGNQEKHMEQALRIRSHINESGCEFYTQIIADYDTYTQVFEMNCWVEATGQLRFEVTKPDTISGITGYFDLNGGNLTFDDKILAFAPLSEGMLTPVSAPWLFVKALEGGYISGIGSADNGYRMQVDDTYNGFAFVVDILMDKKFTPVSAEIYWDRRRVVSLAIDNFRIV